MDECESESKLITVEQAHRLKTWIRDESGTHIVPLVETLIRGYLNSPQFKKEYTTIKECKDFALSEYSRGIDDGWNKANQEFVVEGKATRPEVIELVGETKEHAEQYANREELVEAIRERQILGEITFPEIENIIRTHALKEE